MCIRDRARKYSFSCIGIPLCGDIGIPEATILHDSHRTLAYILLLGTFFMTFKMWRAIIRGIELNLSIRQSAGEKPFSKFFSRSFICIDSSNSPFLDK